MSTACLLTVVGVCVQGGVHPQTPSQIPPVNRMTDRCNKNAFQ